MRFGGPHWWASWGTRGRLVMAVFWNWDDVDPANEVSDQWFISGLDCRGDGESFPGTSIPDGPW